MTETNGLGPPQHLSEQEAAVEYSRSIPLAGSAPREILERQSAKLCVMIEGGKTDHVFFRAGLGRFVSFVFLFL